MFAATVAGAVVLGAVGYLFDLVVGPLIDMHGWWTVFFSGGLILGAILQGVREYAIPLPAEREVVAEELRARAPEGDATPKPDDA